MAAVMQSGVLFLLELDLEDHVEIVAGEPLEDEAVEVEVRALEVRDAGEAEARAQWRYAWALAIEGDVEGHRLGHPVEREVAAQRALAVRAALQAGRDEGDGRVLVGFEV